MIKTIVIKSIFDPKTLKMNFFFENYFLAQVGISNLLRIKSKSKRTETNRRKPNHENLKKNQKKKIRFRLAKHFEPNRIEMK